MFLYTYSVETVQNHLYKTYFRITCKLSYNLLNMVKKVQKQDGFMCPGDSGGLFEHIGFEYKTQWTNTDCNTVHGEAQAADSCEDMAASDMWLTATTQHPYTRYRLGKHRSSNLKGIFFVNKALILHHHIQNILGQAIISQTIINWVQSVLSFCGKHHNFPIESSSSCYIIALLCQVSCPAPHTLFNLLVFTDPGY